MFSSGSSGKGNGQADKENLENKPVKDYSMEIRYRTIRQTLRHNVNRFNDLLEEFVTYIDSNQIYYIVNSDQSSTMEVPFNTSEYQVEQIRERLQDYDSRVGNFVTEIVRLVEEGQELEEINRRRGHNYTSVTNSYERAKGILDRYCDIIKQNNFSL